MQNSKNNPQQQRAAALEIIDDFTTLNDLNQLKDGLVEMFADSLETQNYVAERNSTFIIIYRHLNTLIKIHNQTQEDV